MTSPLPKGYPGRFSGRWPRHRVVTMATWALVAFLSLVMVASLAKGLHRAWARNGDFDMGSRVREYEWFERGVYPNRGLAGEAGSAQVPYTVYPPYALPMFGLFFAPGGRLQGRLLVELLSLASLAVMGLYGLRALQAAGPAMAAVGGLAAAAITGNSTALALGQFSIVSAGLVMQQMIFLERRRPFAAGVCWALAMIKPQIALAFAVLFLMNRQWSGLLVGIGILTGLSLFACLWTGVPPTRLVEHWLFHMPMSFSDPASMSGPGYVAEQIGVSPRVAQFLALALLGVVAALAVRLAPASLFRADQLRVAGACAVLGQLCFYHRHYDNIMLFPSLVGILAVAATTPSWKTVGAAVLMGATIWLPQRAIERLPGHQVLQAMIWSGVAAMLLVSAWRKSRADDEAAAECGASPAAEP